jgi:hypothetical protein
MARGRPALTPEQVQERIDAYCARYKVRCKPDGLPPYPAGERESPQHREWIVLYRTVSRFRRRLQGLPASPERVSALKAQEGRCPICLADVAGDGTIAEQPLPGATMTILHPDCNALLRQVLELGPEVLGRLRSYAWPEPASRRSGKRR